MLLVVAMTGKGQPHRIHSNNNYDAEMKHKCSMCKGEMEYGLQWWHLVGLAKEMGKSKPKLILNTEFEWVNQGVIFPRIEYARKSRLKCCPDMERISHTWGPFYFFDKHYPESDFIDVK